MQASNVIAKPDRLKHSYVPPKLPTREKELSELQDRLLSHFEGGRSFDGIVIYGTVGTGKTHLVKRGAKNLRDEGMLTAYTNCRFTRRTYKTLTNLVRQIESSIPSHGLARDELLRVLVRLIKQKKKRAILIFDEIDALFWGNEEEKAEDMLYTLSRLPESIDLQDTAYTVIAISREADLYKSLDKPTRASFLQREMKLNRYKRKHLTKILSYRADLAFTPSGITPASIDQIASHVADNASANARVGIDLLYGAGKLAEKERKEMVTPSIVRKIIGQHPTLPGIDREMLRGLGTQKLLLLLGIIRALKGGEGGFVTRKEASEAYALVCETYGVEARKSTQIYRYLGEMEERLPILNTSVSGKGRVGRSTRIWISAPLEKLESQVEVVLDDLM